MKLNIINRRPKRCCLWKYVSHKSEYTWWKRLRTSTESSCLWNSVI